MNYDTFIGLVQSRARLASWSEAVSATRATCETLSERLSGGGAEQLASRLPREISCFFSPQAIPLDMDLEEFFNRVAVREGVDLPQGVYDARVVVSVLQEALSGREVEELLMQLPEDFKLLFKPVLDGRVKKAA